MTTEIGRIDSSLPVLVLECHHGSLGVARSLGRLGVDVYGLDADPKVIALRSRYFRDSFEWDVVGRPEEETVSFLLDAGRKIGRKTLLLPTSDHTVILVAKHADVLEERFVFARQPLDLVRKLASKRDNHLLALEAGVSVPHALFPTAVEQVETFANEADFPVMIKGIDGRKLFRRTGRRMVIVRTAEELLDLYRSMEDPEDPNVMLQEYIPGKDDTIWMFNGYFDRNSECRAAFTGRKLRQTPPHTGATSLGICEPNEVVEQTTIDFMKHIGYTGILDIGYRFDARDGRYKLLDPNPRIGSTFRLFVGRNGMDVARYLYLDLTGQPLPTTEPRYGRKWIIEDFDTESLMVYRREGEIGVREWLRSYRGIEEGAWFAWDDIGPFVPVVGNFLGRSFRWLWRAVTGVNHEG